jgi:shikimate kinase
LSCYPLVYPQCLRRKWIALIGDRASGKSTISARVAQELGLDSYDLDLVLAQRVGRDHHSFFRLYGETRFREQEELALWDLPRFSLVLATGGGVCSNPLAMKVLSERAQFLYLDVCKSELLRRRLSKPDSRPILEGFSSVEEEVSALYINRREQYRQRSDWTVSWQGEDVEGMVRKVLRILTSGEESLLAGSA